MSPEYCTQMQDRSVICWFGPSVDSVGRVLFSVDGGVAAAPEVAADSEVG